MDTKADEPASTTSDAQNARMALAIIPPLVEVFYPYQPLAHPSRSFSNLLVALRAPSWISLFLAFVDNTRLFQASRASAPHDGADHSRVKQVLFQTSRASAPHDGADHSRVKQVLFQTSRAPAPHDGADHSRVKQVLFQTSRAPAPHDGADHSRVKQVLFQTSPAPALPGGSYIE